MSNTLESPHRFRERMRGPDWRDTVAAMALQGLLQHVTLRGTCGSPENMARLAYRYSDALMKAMDGTLPEPDEP